MAATFESSTCLATTTAAVAAMYETTRAPLHQSLRFNFLFFAFALFHINKSTWFSFKSIYPHLFKSSVLSIFLCSWFMKYFDEASKSKKCANSWNEHENTRWFLFLIDVYCGKNIFFWVIWLFIQNDGFHKFLGSYAKEQIKIDHLFRNFMNSKSTWTEHKIHSQNCIL